MTTWNAADGNPATVQALHDNASVVAGDTIVIPAGSWTWTSEVSITKQITVTGAGTMPAIGAATTGGTTLNVDAPAAGAALSAREALTGNIVFANLRFVLGATAGPPNYGCILIMVNATSPTLGLPVIMHHLTLEYHRPTENAIRLSTMYGLIYRSAFLNDQQPPVGTPGNTGPTIQCKGNDPYAQSGWASASTFGTDDTTGRKNVYVETCIFTNHGVCIDTDDGCRMVFRYNTLTDAALADHGHDTSGVGVRHYEIYNNTFQCANDWNGGNWYGSRGGTGVIADNIVPLTCFGRTFTLFSPTVQALRRLLVEVFTFTGNYTSGSAVVTNLTSTAGLAVGMGVAVSGSFFNPIVSIDSATQITMGATAPSSVTGATIQAIDCYPGPYPWARQEGWGWDSAGSNPTPMNNQKLEPIYIWNNKGSASGTPGESDNSVSPFDAAFAPFPNGPCAWPSFTGTISGTSVTGITPGTRPYFAGLAITGTGVPANTTVTSVTSGTSLTLSQAATAGTVTLTLNNNNHNSPGYVQANREYYISVAKPGYTKYTYPHPLATVTGGGASVPAAPTGFTVT